MIWQKGQASPNPGGRTKANKEVARLIAANTRNGAELVEFLIGTLRGTAAPAGTTAYPDDARSRIDAAKILLDRLLGKASYHLDVTVGEEPPIDFAALTEAQLEALAALDAAQPAARVLQLVPSSAAANPDAPLDVAPDDEPPAAA